MSRRLPRNVWVLGGLSFLTDLGGEAVFPLLPVFLMSLGAGPAYLGLLEGVADALSSVLGVFSGRHSDRRGRRKGLTVFGYAVAGMVRPLLAFATVPWHVLAVRWTDRVGKGIRNAPRDALLADSTPPSLRGTAFGVQKAMDHLGATLGPLLIWWLMSETGPGLPMRSIFLWVAVPGTLTVLVGLWGIREVPVAAPPRPDGPHWREFRALPLPFWRYLGVVGLFGLGLSSDAFLLRRAVEVGVPQVQIPLMWAAFSALKALCAWPAGILADRWPRKRLLLAGWGVYAVTYAAFSQVDSAAWMWGIFCTYALFSGLTEGTEKALVADMVGPGLRATAFGFFQTVTGVSTLLASLACGILWTEAGPQVALGTAAVCALLATAALARLKLPAR